MNFDSYLRTQRYMLAFLPLWLVEGIAEYIAVFGPTAEIRQKYETGAIKDIVARGEGYLMRVTTRIPDGGAYLVKYMYEIYGQENVVRLIRSYAPNFVAALKKELGITPREFEDRWLKWACDEFKVDYKVYGLSPMYEKEAYTDLLSRYSSLEKDYRALERKYENLSKEYDSSLKSLAQINSELETASARLDSTRKLSFIFLGIIALLTCLNIYFVVVIRRGRFRGKRHGVA